MVLHLFNLSFPLDESVYVVDAGSGLSVVCTAGGGDLEEPSLSDHPVHPTTGETSRGDGETLNRSPEVLSGLWVCLSVCSFGSVACEQTMCLRECVIGWNISQQEQIGITLGASRVNRRRNRLNVTKSPAWIHIKQLTFKAQYSKIFDLFLLHK